LYKFTNKPWNSEAYTLYPMVKAGSLKSLGVYPRDIEIDPIANHKNPKKGVLLSKRNQCFPV